MAVVDDVGDRMYPRVELVENSRMEPSSRDSGPLPPPKMPAALSLLQCRHRTNKLS